MKIDISNLQPVNPGPVGKDRISVNKNLFTKNISLPGFGNKNKLRYRFFQEISVLLTSGLDLKSSLDIIHSGLTKEKEKKSIKAILESIIKGSTLSEALAANTLFTPYEYYSVKIGEETGELPSVSAELALFYNKKISQQRHLRGAMAYPTLVLLTTIISLGFMLRVIVPMFDDVFKRFQGELPALTRSIIQLSELSAKYSVYVLVSIIGLSVFILLNRKKNRFRKVSSLIASKIPILNRIILLTYKARFCQTLRLLVTAKVHLVEAVNLIRKMIGYYPFEVALQDIKEKLSTGSSLSESMKTHHIFDQRMIALTKVAEEVNKLEIVYDQLYNQYSEELEVKIKAMNALLEPILIIIVGGLVAVMLIAMYMPIFQIGVGLG